MSAIPWLGQSIVESKINIIVFLSILPVIGIVHKNAIKKYKNYKGNEEYLSIPSSFIAFLVGLIDGDGYIQITKSNRGFITIKLVISLHLDDLSTVEYIHSVLKIGKVYKYNDIRSPVCKLIINRTDLQQIFFPLLLHHKIFFLTETRSKQFNLAFYILKENIKIYSDIDFNHISNYLSVKTPIDYYNLFFIKNWIVGFTVSEGSFIIKNNKDGCFQLKQRLPENLFESLKLIFNTNRKISIEKCQLSVSSKYDIQKVINFFSFSGLHPLVGLKNIQYLKWLNDLHNSNRYKNLNYPNN